MITERDAGTVLHEWIATYCECSPIVTAEDLTFAIDTNEYHAHLRVTSTVITEQFLKETPAFMIKGPF